MKFSLNVVFCDGKTEALGTNGGIVTLGLKYVQITRNVAFT